MADNKPIIVIKKKGGHGGHHGGAWKVAYADFVTAMMAFFMVMWLVNSADVVTKKSIASYFKKPGIFEQGSGTPLMIGEAGILQDAYVPTKKLKKGSTGGRVEADKSLGKHSTSEPQPETPPQNLETAKMTAAQEEQALEKQDALKQELEALKEKLKELEKIKASLNKKSGGENGKQGKEASKEQLLFEKAAKEIREMIAGSPELQKLLGIVDAKVEADGLNIEIMDTEKASMFASGSAFIQAEAEIAFARLAGILAKIPNKMDIVGHTDAKPFSVERGGYSNWELSTDRANSARRLLEAYGVPSERIRSVMGQADTQLRLKEAPFDASNRRITLKMRFEKKELPADFQETPVGAEVVPSATPASSDLSILQDQSLKPADEPKDKSQDTFHSYTPKQVIRAVNKSQNRRITLPEDDEAPSEGSAATSTPAKKEKIFGESPVISGGDPFGNQW